MALTTINTMPPAVQEHFDKKMLAVHIPDLIYGFGVMRRDMPANAGRYARLGRLKNFPLAMIPLPTSGITPPSVSTTRTDIDVEIQFFGQWSSTNEQVVLQNENAVLNDFSNLHGISLRRTEDALIRDCIMSSAAFIRAVGGGNGDIPTEVSASDIDAVTTELIGNDAKRMFQLLHGEDRFGSAPISNAFMGLCHSNMIPSLNAMPDFTERASYPRPDMALEQTEEGSIHKVRVFVSSQGAIMPNASALGNDVYPLTIMGAEAVVAIDQDSFTSQFVYRPAYINDPLARNSTMAWVACFANAISDDEWILNLQCTI